MLFHKQLISQSSWLRREIKQLNVERDPDKVKQILSTRKKNVVVMGRRWNVPERRGVVGGCVLSCTAEPQVWWQSHLAKEGDLDLMDETNCRLFPLVTLKSLSLLHGYADFYGHLRQSAGFQRDGRGNRETVVIILERMC